MEFELKGALKKYGRMRAWRRFGIFAVLLVGFTVPWIYSFNRTDTMLCWLLSAVLWGLGETELRLKTMQVRLAGMADKLDRLSGNAAEADNLILELNDW
jgi:hypothetical protein